MYNGTDRKSIMARLKDCVQCYEEKNTPEQLEMLLENVMVEVIALLALEK